VIQEPEDRSPGHDERHWSDDRFRRYLDALSGPSRGPVVVVDSTGSTNADVVDQATEGAPAGFTVVAHEQVSGRGRLDRLWTSPAGAGVAMSMVVRPEAPVAQWGWLPLLTGVAVVDACHEVGLSASLKWPNDVIVEADGVDGRPGPRKLGGILVQRVDATGVEGAVAGGVAAVIGVGLNVDVRIDELPIPTATSFRLEGVSVERELLVARILDLVMSAVQAWDADGGDVVASGLRDRYRRSCSTIGQQVRAERPDGSSLTGLAVDVEASGALAIHTADGHVIAVTAGDIVHLRTAT